MAAIQIFTLTIPPVRVYTLGKMNRSYTGEGKMTFLVIKDNGD